MTLFRAQVWLRSLFAVALLVGGALLAPAPQASAAQACGEVTVSWRSWLGGFGVDARANGYAQGTGTSCGGWSVNSPSVQYGEGWQCVELAQRLYWVRGWYSSTFPVSRASQIFDQASNMGMTSQANGSITKIVPGDMIIHSSGTFGHVTIVDRVSGGVVHAVQQNSSSGRIDYSYSNGTLKSGKASIRGVVHSPKNRLTIDPVGSLDEVSEVAPGTIRVRGWAGDPQKKAGPLLVRVYVDGALVSTFRASRSRPDVHAVHPAYGSSLGYDRTIKLHVPGGTKSVCTRAVNVGAGADVQLGCQSVVVRDASPFGSLDYVGSELNDIIWRGWAADPNLPNGPIRVNLFVNGTYKGYAKTHYSRPDVPAVFPGYGSNLGYSVRNGYGGGNTVRVCVRVNNVGAGVNTPTKEIGCKDVYVRPPSYYYGHIVKWSGDTKAQKTSWYVDGNGKRHWIPDSKTYWCLRDRGAPAANVLSARALNQLPDQNGDWAKCS
ncbi:MAG TPA: CHAP domain-containing protein [Propionicimonas sp.]|jgi:hypothetical protein